MLSSRRSVRRRTAKEISYTEDGTDPSTAVADRAARDKERELQYAKLQRQKRRKFTRWEKQVQVVGPFHLLKWVRTHEEFYDNVDVNAQQQYVQEDSAPMTLEEASQILEAHERRRKRTKDGAVHKPAAAGKAPAAQAAGKTPAINAADKQQNGSAHKDETQSVADSTAADLTAHDSHSVADDNRLDELKSRYADEEEAEDDSDNDDDEEAEEQPDDISNADGYENSNHPTLHQQHNQQHAHAADDQLSEPEHDLDDVQAFDNSGMNMNIDEDAFGGPADDLI